MSLADQLLQASVSWRGIPPEFTAGSLAEIGERLTTAFEVAPFYSDLANRQYAFEYLTGLLFNGRYATLDALKDLVGAWLDTEAGGVRFLGDPTSPPPGSPYDVPLIETFNDPTRSAIYASGPFQVGVGTARWNLYSPLYTWTIDQWRLTLWQDHPMRQVTLAYFWSETGPNGIYMQGTKFEPEDRLPAYEVSLEPVPLSTFKPEVLTAINTYTSDVKSQERPVTPISETAACFNPNIFPCWAEERYGSPVAY